MHSYYMLMKSVVLTKKTTKCSNCEIDFMTQKPIKKDEKRLVLKTYGIGSMSRQTSLCRACALDYLQRQISESINLMQQFNN